MCTKARKVRSAFSLLALIGVAVSAGASGRPVSGSTNGRQPHVNYMLECQGCHLPDGRGMGGRVPALRGEVQHFLAVPGGREYLVQVPGSANSKLSDRDLADLLNWMLVEFGGKTEKSFTAYSASEVNTYRNVKIAGVAARRLQLINALQSKP